MKAPGNIVVIVSGLPRSGTSMMMGMLKAGGLPLLTDNLRKADEDNPRGYYEFERVKGLKQDKTALDQAAGKAVKVVSPLLFHLPLNRGFTYKVIFMRRNLDEILASQQKMASRLSGEKEAVSQSGLKTNYLKHLKDIDKWLKQNRIDAINIDYDAAIKNPAAVAAQVSSFLKIDLDRQLMITAIDKALYRQKNAPAAPQDLDLKKSENELIEEQLRQLGYL